MSLDSKAMADSGRRDSLQSVDDDADQQEGLAGVAGMMLSQSFASGSMTELSSLCSMSEDVSHAYINNALPSSIFLLPSSSSSSAVLAPRLGHTMYELSPSGSVFCVREDLV